MDMLFAGGSTPDKKAKSDGWRNFEVQINNIARINLKPRYWIESFFW